MMKEIEHNNFERIKRFAANISRSKQLKNSRDEGISIPDAVGVKLTNRCNLRCKHCYEWNEQGYHNNMSQEVQNTDISFDIIKKCVSDTETTSAMFYLWGGEPLLYQNIEALLELLSKEERYTVICTNGLLMNQYIELLCRFDENIELLFALEGDQESNDKLRGTGNFDKAITNIKKMIALKSEDKFKGKISVHTMISNENIDTLPEFVSFLDAIGIDHLILCFPWYISEETSMKMDRYFSENFSDFNKNIHSVPSWHAYKYRIEPANFSKVHEKVGLIRNNIYNMSIHYQPNIKDDELTCFLEGKDIEQCNGRECYTLYSRIDLLPNGMVSSCKHFQELAYGDLHQDSLINIWNSEKMKYIRHTICHRQMPVCSKCNNLYQHSYQPTKR